MADINKAYRFLSESLGLNLSEEQIQGHEMGFKMKWMEEKGFEASQISHSNVNNWEFFAYLVPRKVPTEKNED